MDSLQIRTLGGLSIRRNGETIADFASRKAELLLVYLASNPRVHRRELLADLLWDDRTQRRALGNLRVVLSSLRKVAEPFVTITRDTAGINPDLVWLDAAALEHGIAAEVTAETAGALAEALDLYRGDFLAGVHVRGALGFEEWAAGERERLHRLALGGFRRLVDHYLEVGEYRAGIARVTRLLELDPLLEAGHRQMMALLARSGRRAAALAQYETCCQLLTKELGVEPATETTALYEAICNGELAEPSAAPPWRAAATPTVASLPVFLTEAGSEGIEDTVFVAREPELAWLSDHLDGALSGNGRILFVTGEAGTGKTALLQAFARRASEAQPELLVAVGRGSALSGRGDPYLSFRQILGQLMGDVEGALAGGHISVAQAMRLWHGSADAVADLLQHGPGLVNRLLSGPALLARMEAATGGEGWLAPLRELARQDMQSLAETTDLQQQVTAVFQAWARRRPLLLLLDDVHWADSASLDLLFHLSHHLAGRRILLACAYRPEEMDTAGELHPLAKVVNEARRRFGDVVLNLAPARQQEGRAFVDGLLDTEPNRLGESFRQELLRRTGGHPLFAVELLRAMQARGDLVQDGEGVWVEGLSLDWTRLPAAVDGVIGERVGRVPPELRRLLEIASVEGETFTAEVLAAVLAVDVRQVQRRLSGELDRRYRLVRAEGRETVDGRRLARYRFRHVLFRQYLYGQLDDVERTYRHEDVGLALEALYGAEAGSIAGRLARHYVEAELDDKALDYLQQAGDAARLLFAHEEAVAHYRRALAILQRQADHERAARTLMKLGLTYHQAFRYREAQRAYDEGFRLRQMPTIPSSSMPRAPHALHAAAFEPTTLDPALHSDTASHNLAVHQFAGLVAEYRNQGIVPDVAQRWEIREGGRTYVFHLRSDVRWSDGTPLTAHDFAFAWQRALAPATGAPLASILFDVRGAEPFHRGEATVDELGISAPDAHTFVVELAQPAAYFLSIAASAIARAVPRHKVMQLGNGWTEDAHLVVSGGYCLERWERGRFMELRRNAGYHLPFRGNVERVRIEFYSGEREDAWQRLTQRYQSDQIDVVEFNMLDFGALRLFGRRHIEEIVTIPGRGTEGLRFRLKNTPFADAHVRRAFALAIDRNGYIRVGGSDYTVPAHGGWIPPAMPGHTADLGHSFDPVRARQALARAGFPGGRGFPPVTFLSPDRFASAKEYRWLAHQWQTHLGVAVEWQLLPWAEFVHTLSTGRGGSLSWVGWGPDYPDPDNFMRVAFPGWYPVWENQRYRGLVAKARRLADQQQRVDLYRQADRILIEDAYVLPLAYHPYVALRKPWVTHLRTLAMGELTWNDTVVEPH